MNHAAVISGDHCVCSIAITNGSEKSINNRHNWPVFQVTAPARIAAESEKNSVPARRSGNRVKGRAINPAGNG